MLDTSLPIFALVTGVVCWVVTTGLRRGELVAPYSVAMFALTSIFAIRPLYLAAEGGSIQFYGYVVSSGANTAVWLGILAMLALTAGHLAIRNRRTTIPTGSGKSDQSEIAPSIRIAAIIALLLLATWLVIIVSIGGGLGFLSLLSAGRSSEVNDRAQNVPVLVPALPVAGALFLASARIRLERLRRISVAEQLIFWATILACAIPPLAVGTRRFIVPTLIAAIMAATVRRWNSRLTIGQAALFPVAFLLLAALPFVRSAGSRAEGQDLGGATIDYLAGEGLSESLRNFFVSYDTEMFNYVAFLSQRLGDRQPFGYGRGTLGDALLAPLPAFVGGPTRWSDQILVNSFGATCSDGICPVPSLVGVLYSDLWFPGVIVGFTLLGLFTGRVRHSLSHATGYQLNIFVTFAAFTIVMVRGNSMAILWIAFNVAVLCCLLEWVSVRYGRSALATASMTH